MRKNEEYDYPEPEPSSPQDSEHRGIIDSEAIADQLRLLLADIEAARSALGSSRNDFLAGDHGGYLQALKTLSIAAVTLSKEARAWIARSKELSTKLTLQERIDLTVAFVNKLGMHDRREFLAKIRAIEIPYGLAKQMND